MATFWAIVKNETRQLLRRRSFWVIQVLLLLPSPLIGFGPPIATTLVLLYLVLPILAGPPLLRDAGRSGEILWSSPTGALVHFAGVLAGLWLGLALGSLLQITAWFLADLFFPNSFSLWIYPLSLAFLLLADTVGLFLTALLAMLLRRIVPLLIAWTVSWLWIFLDVIFSASLSEGFNPMQAKIFTNIFFHNLILSPSLGLGLSSSRVFGMSTWFLGLGMLAAGLGLALSLFVDRRRSLRRPQILPALILIGALATAGGYTLNARAAAAHALPVSPYDPQIDVWEVTSQQSDVEVNIAAGMISGTSRLHLKPVRPVEKPEVVLRLNPGLEAEYVRDASGAELTVSRVGDSVVVSLPAIPQAPLQLELAWQGRLQIPYLSFEQEWKFSDGPDLVPYLYMPAPLKALVVPRGGFLLRDGDWMPWPWSSSPHQAPQNTLTIRLVGGEAAAAHPLKEGGVTFEGDLPEGLIAFLPENQIGLSQTTTIAVSSLAGEQHTARARLFASTAGRLAALFGEQPPRYVVVAPYLSDLVWSGDLLLIPDGSGFYQSNRLWWTLHKDFTGPDQPRLERTVLYLLARLWLHDRFALPPLPYQPLISPPGENTREVSLSEFSEERWYQENGHWLQFAEVMDIHTTWDPRRNSSLTGSGEQSVLAFWLTMELTDEETRQADLDLLAYFAGVGQQLTGYGDRYRMMSGLIWPDIMETRQARELTLDLHQWAVRAGPEEAVAMSIEVIREAYGWDLNQILAELEARSGVSIEENQR